MTWEAVAEYFEPDGSLLDVAVFDTDLSDWRRLVQYLLASGLDLRLTVDDEPRELADEGVEGLLHASEESSVLLSLYIAGMQFNCHFLGSDEIEFDIDPKEVTETNFASLLEFMRSVASHLERDVVLGGENMAHYPFLVYSVERAAFDLVRGG